MELIKDSILYLIYSSFIHGGTYKDSYGFLKLWIVPALYIVAFHVHLCMYSTHINI